MEEERRGARLETLARTGFPSLNRWSAGTVGRLAYALGVGSVTWLLAVANVYLDVPRTTLEWIIRGGGSFLLSIFPFVLAAVAIPKNRSPLFADPGRQHLISIAGGVVGIAGIEMMLMALNDVVRMRGHYAEFDYIGIGGILVVLAAAVVIPLAPIVQFANNLGVGEDHAPRMRWRIGVSLAVNMAVRLLIFFLLIGLPSQYMWPDESVIYGSCYSVMAVVLVIAMIDVVRSAYVLARTKSWIARARAGRVTGVRVRDGEGEELTAAPTLLHLETFADVALVEAVPLETYRTTSQPLALGVIPAR